MKTNYIRNFDGLRGLAVLSVLVFHASYGRFQGGFLGVDLFFVISGYLITSLLFEEYQQTGAISFAKFYKRRALRLLPALILGVIFANILWPVTTLDLVSNRTVATLAALFYSTNLINDRLLGNMSHFWSLSVEEHFYFVWPFLMAYFVVLLSPARRFSFLLILLIAVTIFRMVAFLKEGEWTYKIFAIGAYEFTLCRIDCILMGALLFFYLRQRQQTNAINTKKVYRWNLICFVAFLILGITVNMQSAYWNLGGFVFTNFLCLCIVFLAIRTTDHPIFSNNILVWIGKRSYGLYVYHFPIFLAAERFRVAHSFGNFILVNLISWTLSIGVAASSYEFAEKPLLEQKPRHHVQQSH